MQKIDLLVLVARRVSLYQEATRRGRAAYDETFARVSADPEYACWAVEDAWSAHDHAFGVYASAHNLRDSWDPTQELLDILEDLDYRAFGPRVRQILKRAGVNMPQVIHELTEAATRRSQYGFGPSAATRWRGWATYLTPKD
jgi:hypothetical protein